MPDEPENTKAAEEQQQLVRFRRWIAMTPDSKWREFRGTADMVNVGKDKDIVELVDSMMLARISHFDQMMSGWKIMRGGLTPNNADWIYSELMSSLASVMQFEMNNFSKTNSWAAPQNPGALPRYLSDCPVRDGGTMSAVTTGQNQLMVRFVDSNSAKQTEYLKALFGDFVPKQLLEMFEGAESNGSFEGTSREFLAQGSSSQVEEAGTTATPTSSSTSLPSQTVSSQASSNTGNRRNPWGTSTTQSSAPKQCSGIGITFNPRNRGTTITVLGTPTPPALTNTRAPQTARPPPPPPQASRPSPQQQQNLPRPPPLMSQINQSCPPGFPPLPGTAPIPAPPPNSQVLALLVVQRPTGEMVTMGYVPVNCQALVNPNASGAYPLPPPPVLHRTETNTQETGRVPSNPSSSASQQNDSGFCSSGDPESTRGSTPSNASSQGVEHLRWRTSGEATPQTATFCLQDNELPVSATLPKLVPTYASVVTMREINRPDSILSPVVFMDNSVVGTESEAQGQQEPQEVQEERMEEDVTSIPDENSSSSNQPSNEWKIVKNKHPVVVVVISEPKRKRDGRTAPTAAAVVEVSESGDDVEVDEAEEQKIEKRRLRRQRQRAAKVQRRMDEKNEGKKKEEEDGGAVEEEGETSEVVEHQGAPRLESSSRQQEDRRQPAPVLNSSGQRKFSDYDIIKEEIEEDDDAEEPAELLFIQSREHSKLMFRLLWFDNKRKLDKLYIDQVEKKRLQSLLDMVRIMKDRVDMAGRMIVYRVGRPQISAHIEENIVKVARNLIDVTRHTVDNDMGMARTVCDLVGKMAKNFTYLNYVFSILTLPEDFFPKLTDDDPRLKAYKEIITLTHLHMKRVEKIYENLGELYEFKIEKVPKRHRRQ